MNKKPFNLLSKRQKNRIITKELENSTKRFDVSILSTEISPDKKGDTMSLDNANLEEVRARNLSFKSDFYSIFGIITIQLFLVQIQVLVKLHVLLTNPFL